MGTSGIVYLGYQWYRGYQENGLSRSMLARPFLPSPKNRPDAPLPGSNQTEGLPLQTRPDNPQASDDPIPAVDPENTDPTQKPQRPKSREAINETTTTL